MPVAFTPCAGAVAIIKPKNCTGAIFKIKFGGVKGGQLTAPTSGFALELNGNYQFLHTVNDFIYVYAFGDRVGELTVSGFGFVKPCPGADSAKICNVYDFYQKNRIKENGKMSVTIGDCANSTFWAFLTGMRLELQDPQTLVGQWSLRFNIVPKK
jgi:hypothetical protein